MMDVLIRPATKADWQAVNGLIEKARRIYIGWEAEELREDVSAFWVAKRGEKLLGFLICVYRQPDGAWLEGIGLAEGWPSDAALKRILPFVIESLRQEGRAYLACLGSECWLARPLQEEWGFRICARIVTYIKTDWAVPGRGSQKVQIRPASQADIPSLVEIDRHAFAPLWRNDAEAFARLMKNMSYFVVAISEGKVVGYQCNRLQIVQGHLARLAVHPTCQGRGIGTRLMAEAIDYFRKEGVQTITLNTQRDNFTAQRLYRWFNFHPSGQDMPVLKKAL